VSHRYGRNLVVLEDIDLQVGPSETIAIVAPSGSGKTTLLSILGGLLAPSGGSVLLDGQPLASRGLPVGTLAWVFQTINLFSRRTAGDNVAIGALALGLDNHTARRDADYALARVDLGGFGHRRANTLSGGEAQRVGIARALAGRPRYLLADEPTGQLDRSTSAVVADALFSARSDDMTIMIATHDLGVAERCERVLAIVNGRLQEQ
jgi:putative ABC transport system ATP-binding protein/lipoprotein-releasing system ATP-binding protein